MSGLTTAQIDWTTQFVGFDIASPGNGASGSPGNGASGDAADEAAGGKAKKSGATAKGLADRFEGGGPGGKSPGGTGQAKAPPAPKDPALAGKLKALDETIAAVGKSGFDTTQMKADAADLAKHAARAEAQTDRKKRERAIKAAIERADEEIEHIGALSKSLKDVMGKSTDAPNEDQKSKAYQKALKDYYGLKIAVPNGMKNTHFDKVFDMFGTVPKGDVKHDKLKVLKYNKKPIGGVYDSADYSIEMGDFKDATGSEDDPKSAYTVDGKQVKANSFDVTTLHEIGHSVDEKHGIMNANQGKAGCGEWKTENLDDVVTAFVGALKTEAKPDPRLADKLLTGAVHAALAKGAVRRPTTIPEAEWSKILPFLRTKCLPIRDKAEPYFSNAPVFIGDRAYTQSDPDWFSYSVKARGATRVNNYQWRSPSEWFAEVYAISWLKKHRPPNAVDGAVKKHCWTK